MKTKRIVSLMLALVSVVIFLSRSGVAFGQTTAISKRLDQFFINYNKNEMFNGVVLAAENGKITYKKAFGFSNFNKKKLLDTSGVFAIGSITKPFTAIAIMMLKERGLLSYEDKLKKYFPEFPSYTDSITIRNLLTHTSGLPDYYNDLHLANLLPMVTTKIAVDSLIKQHGLKFKPGEKFSSSNSNYLLLALIIEKVSKKPYCDFLQNNIFKPLGMNHTTVYDETIINIPGRVNAYGLFFTTNEIDLQHKAIGAGDIYSTIDDLFLFDQALYSDKLISRKTLEAAFDTTGLLKGDVPGRKYGFGWAIDSRYPDNIFLSNTSGIGRFTGMFIRFVNKNNTLIILSNYSNSPTDDIKKFYNAVMIMMGKTYTPPKISITSCFYNWYKSDFEEAMDKLKEAKKDTAKYDFSEDPLNNLGYYFLQNQKDAQSAIRIFKFIVRLYPESSNAYDSLGEAYMVAGNIEIAIQNYEKSLKLDPLNTNATEKLKELRKMQY